MKCAHLIRALETIASKSGYKFHSGKQEILTQSVKEYPAAWLTTPYLRKVEGRKRGRVSYDITLHLMKLAPKLTPTQQSKLLGTMEQQLLTMFQDLTLDNSIVTIDDIRVKSNTFSLTNHGEISQSATATVILIF